ncbi:MAG: hypothetical protein IJP92_01475, partial [Lachnospiraceae bacterium]|nr:hypothetical protein [Lachnospiraceae bacterium]
MRITNKIMQNNSLYNINNNKVTENDVSTAIMTGKKINRPSEDPVIAIRALRLRANVSELSQYYEKNVKDASAWLQVTESALTSISGDDSILVDLKKLINAGPDKYKTLSDWQAIVTQIEQLSDEYYNVGNVDYAGRYAFTGYRTDTSLSFMEDTSKKYVDIQDEFNAGNIDTSDRVTRTGEFASGDELTNAMKESDVSLYTVGRLRLSYDNLDIKKADPNRPVSTIESELSTAEADLSTAKTDLDAKKADLDTGKTALLDAKKEQYNKQQVLSEKSSILNTANETLTKAQDLLTSLQDELAAMDPGDPDYPAKQAEVSNAQTAVTDAQAAVTAAQTEVDTAQTEYDDATTEVNNRQTTVDTAQTAYDASLDIYQDAQEKAEELREELDSYTAFQLQYRENMAVSAASTVLPASSNVDMVNLSFTTSDGVSHTVHLPVESSKDAGDDVNITVENPDGTKETYVAKAIMDSSTPPKVDHYEVEYKADQAGVPGSEAYSGKIYVNAKGVIYDPVKGPNNPVDFPVSESSIVSGNMSAEYTDILKATTTVTQAKVSEVK